MRGRADGERRQYRLGKAPALNDRPNNAPLRDDWRERMELGGIVFLDPAGVIRQQQREDRRFEDAEW